MGAPSDEEEQGLDSQGKHEGLSRRTPSAANEWGFLGEAAQLFLGSERCVAPELFFHRLGRGKGNEKIGLVGDLCISQGALVGPALRRKGK